MSPSVNCEYSPHTEALSLTLETALVKLVCFGFLLVIHMILQYSVNARSRVQFGHKQQECSRSGPLYRV